MTDFKMKRDSMRKPLYRTGLSLLALLVLSGCAKLGPDFGGIANPPVPKKWKQNTNHKDPSVTHWWRTFHDPTLNTLVNKAYAQNLDIKSAGLRIAQARAALGISQGLAFPQLQTVSGQATSTRTGLADVATAGVNFDMGWEMDIWGKYARGIESSEAQLYASVASYDNIMVSVIAEVARNYINYRTAQERLIYAHRNVVIQERVTKMTEIQFNSGNVSELDMQQARTQLYNTRTSIPAIELNKVKARNALALLLGTDAAHVEKLLKQKDASLYNNSNKFIGQHKGIVQVKEEGHNGLTGVNLVPKPKLNPRYRIDANLLTRRPDIKAAEYQVHANSALIGAKMADLYPSITLFGNIGYNTNNQSGSWLNGTTPLGVTVGPSFSWNIFNYGRIKNQIRLQDAKFEESLVKYNKSVLSAVSEVSNALNGYVLTRKQQVENQKAVEATIRAFNISVVQYNDGLVNYQRLLTTVEKLTSTQDRFASIKGNVALNAIALYKSLGGGWQISRGKSYISRETAEKMKKRTDWGKYLDPEMTRLPKGFYDDK
ncbi:TolC family protein [Sulfurovum sp. NBC37-1]|uniref:TolC family protein n=1 Tax=Sulfurovum sp. (strain NBC37-1) TaxID=387093 RepID=UPI0001587D02|nr:TolC family protein [Sulfurovum sp. NBC37-1]BAF72296.1 outer membrane efflux lipoprotein [Sulfurovum sp. NBC37-1]